MTSQQLDDLANLRPPHHGDHGHDGEHGDGEHSGDEHDHQGADGDHANNEPAEATH